MRRCMVTMDAVSEIASELDHEPFHFIAAAVTRSTHHECSLRFQKR